MTQKDKPLITIVGVLGKQGRSAARTLLHSGRYRAVLEIFSNPSQYAGKSLPVIGDIISPQEMVDTFTRVTGKKATYSSAFTREGLLHHFPEFSSNEMLVREILGMVDYVVEYDYFRKDRDLLWSRQINPKSLSWENFLHATGWKGQKLSY